VGASEAVQSGDYVDFAHGTHREHAANIVSRGVNREEILRHSVGSHEPGSFFAVRVEPADRVAALETAAMWGSRHAGETCVLVCRLPGAAVRELQRAGSLVHTVVPRQSVFREEAFATVNRLAQWIVVPVAARGGRSDDGG